MPTWESVRESLENPKYKWRTIRGVAKQLNCSQEEILKILAQYKNEIIKSSIPAESGEELYTTRSHYKRTTPFFDKALSSVTGTITASLLSSDWSIVNSYKDQSDFNSDEE